MENEIFDMLFPKVCFNGKKVRLIELFGGIGSQLKAYEVLERNYPDKVIVEHYRLIEIDKYCVCSYNAIHNTNYKIKDITKIGANDLGIENTDEYIYVMTYSFPCQDISTAGLMKGFEEGSGTRSSLLWEVIRLLKTLNKENRPQILIMENVAAIENSKNMNGFKKLQNELKKLGYRNFVEQLNLKEYGIPQNRLRCFMISTKNNLEYYFPKKITPKHYMQEFLQDAKTIPDRYYLSPKLLNLFLDKKPHGFYVRVQRFKPFSYDEKNIAWTIETRQGGHPNNNYIYYPKDFYKGNKEVGIMKKEEKEFVVRNLTPLELYILMGFEVNDYYKVKDIVSPTQLIKQAGNSIGVTVLIAIISMFYDGIDYEKVINEYVNNILLEKRKKFPKNKENSADKLK